MNHYLEQILQIDIQFKPVPMLESWPYLFGRKYALYKYGRLYNEVEQLIKNKNP